MKEYTSLKSVLDTSRIPQQFQTDCGVDNILSWALDAYRLLKVPEQLENKVILIEIKDHQIQLNSEVKLLNSVVYFANKPHNYDCDGGVVDLIYNNSNDTNPTSSLTHIVGDYAIAHKIFLESKYYRENAILLKYTGNTNGDNICKNCPNKFCNDCTYDFTVDSNKVLWCSIKTGYLCIEYMTEIKQGTDYKIINTPEILRYLSLYCQAQCYLNKSSIKEESAYQMYDRLLQQTEVAFKRAKGSEILKSIDSDTISSIYFKNRNQRLVNITKGRSYERRI